MFPHKASHFTAGAVAGGVTAAINGGDVKLSAVSQGFGATVGHTTAEAAGDLGMETNKAGQFGHLMAVGGLGLAMDMDANAVLMGASNAVEHNHNAHSKDPSATKEDEKDQDESTADAIRGLSNAVETEKQDAIDRGRAKYVEECLIQAPKGGGRAISPEGYIRVVENARRTYDQSRGSAEVRKVAIETVFKPENILLAASYLPGPTGLVTGAVDNVYGYATGDKSGYDAMVDTVMSAVSVLRSAKILSKFAKPGREEFGEPANNNFGHKPAANSNQMPSTLRATGTTGGTTGASMQNLANKFGGGTKLSAPPRTMENFASSPGLGKRAPTSGTRLGTIHEEVPSAPTTKLGGDDPRRLACWGRSGSSI